MENESGSYVNVKLKKSSSTGKVGFDIDVRVAQPNEELMNKLAELAIKVSLKTQQVLTDRGM